MKKSKEETHVRPQKQKFFVRKYFDGLTNSV